MQEMQRPPPSAGVIVAMSGGVDSSIAAMLLKQEGYTVLGLTLQLYGGSGQNNSASEASNQPDFIQRARHVSELLEIPHQVLPREALFQEKIIDPFCREYSVGRTPNPCVWCNATVKWQGLLEYARAMNCRYVATGHYVRLAPAEGRYRLLRGLDPSKDQSYVLYRLSQEALRATLFPLGAITKDAVRAMAEDLWPAIGSIQESQDICFIPDGNYRKFLSPRIPQSPGTVEDLAGNRLGTHMGLAFYTVGQRKGLGIAAGEPIYVIEKDLDNNRLIMGPREALCRQKVIVKDINWVSIDPPPVGSTLTAEVEVRYQTRPLPIELLVLSPDSACLTLPHHNQSLAPGQSAVWYQGEILLGGGIIDSAS